MHWLNEVILSNVILAFFSFSVFYYILISDIIQLLDDLMCHFPVVESSSQSAIFSHFELISTLNNLV